MNHSLESLFGVSKPLIGMIHLAGRTPTERVKRAIDELTLYEEEGIDGAILEDYHGNPNDLVEALMVSQPMKFSIPRGVNFLANPLGGFNLAHLYGAQFVQLDTVQSEKLKQPIYSILREQHSELVVLGGVRFKYTLPTNKSLEEDIADGRRNCDAIVTTGDGTGIETPLHKLESFKKLLPDFPLVVGAGVNEKNAYEQLTVADGAIIGSYFKINRDTENTIDRSKVRDLVNIARSVRESLKK